MISWVFVIKEVFINMGTILNGYGAVSVFKFHNCPPVNGMYVLCDLLQVLFKSLL
jgi:hypothetical protein